MLFKGMAILDPLAEGVCILVDQSNLQPRLPFPLYIIKQTPNSSTSILSACLLLTHLGSCLAGPNFSNLPLVGHCSIPLRFAYSFSNSSSIRHSLSTNVRLSCLSRSIYAIAPSGSLY